MSNMNESSITEISYDNFKVLLCHLNDPNNNTRKNAEEMLKALKNNIQSYVYLLTIFQKENDKNVKIQSLLVLKNLMKQILSIAGDKYRAKIAGLENSSSFKGNINYSQTHIHINFFITLFT